MKITSIAFSSYPVNDIEASRDFYENILGLKATSVFEQDEMAFIEYDLGGSTLAIGKGAPNFSPGLSGATVAFEVDDFEAMLKKLKENKVTFLMEPMDTGVCHMALINDPSGNQIMIHKKK